MAMRLMSRPFTKLTVAKLSSNTAAPTRAWHLIPLCSALLIQNAYAQPFQDAGAFQQSIEQELRNSPQPPKRTPPVIPEPSVLKPSGVLFTLTKIKLSGNSLIDDASINLIIEPYLNRQIDFSQLQKISYEIEAAYRLKGYLARVRLPPQDIEQGVVAMQLEESIFGGVKIEQESSRIKPAQIQSFIQSQQASGKLVNVDNLDRGLLLADDLPGVTVSGILLQGQHALETDIGVSIETSPLVTGDVQVDNTGPNSIGAYRGLANVNFNSPLGFGDLFSATYLHSAGSDYGRIGYSVPLGSDGLRIGINASTMQYRLTSQQFTNLGSRGASSTGGLEANYPLIRSRTKNLYVGFNADYREFQNSNNIATISQYSSLDYSISLYGNSLDQFGGFGSSSGSIILTRGSINLNQSPNQNAVAATTNAQGDFTKLRFNLNRTQSLPHGFSLYGSISGQYTQSNLDSSEQFYLGGAYGVRAYPANEGAGSTGQLLTIELRRNFLPNLTLSAFYDYGRVRAYVNNNFAGANSLNTFSLQGAGLSINWQPHSRINIKTTWARRLGNNPNQTVTGTDQDGTHSLNRFWLIASLYF